MPFVSAGCGPDPDAAMHEFYGSHGREDTLMDPLIRCGERVVPNVLAAIDDKGMPRRRYAIAFLGNGEYRQAIPVLERILADDLEEDVFRTDALEAIACIDRNRGRLLAATFTDRSDDFGLLAGQIVDGTRKCERRGYWRALVASRD